MAQAKLPKIVQDIKDCLHDIKKEYQEGQVPITDDSVPLHKLCAKLEYMLQIDMKARNSVWRGRLDYWDYIYHCLAKIKGLNDGVRFVRAMSEIKSSLGRGRAFIRYSLVHHRLGDSLQQCFSNVKVTSEWYKPSSVLTNPSYYSAFLNELYDLNDIQFDLAPTGHDLDTAWPTFARKTLPGVNSLHLWTPPSRSSSISSLSSQPSTTDGLSSPQSESALFGMEEQYQKVQKDFEECEILNRQLRKKIDQLEKDNEEMHKLALETEDRMGAVQNDLLRRNQDLEYQVDKVTRELRSKEEQLTGFEDAKERTKEAEKLNTDLYARIDVLNTQHESREKLLLESERTLQERLQMIERELSDLKLQEHSLQGELEARRLSEERRVNQVQELEAKITCLEGKNVELLARMEGMVQDKDEKVSGHFQSANKVHELLAKLEGVEHQNIALKGANEGLNRKVQELEDSKTKSNTEAEILRGSLEERTKELSHTSQQKYEKIGVLENENKTLRTKNNDLTLRVEELGRTLQEMEIKKQEYEHKSKQLQIDVENLVAKEGKHKQEQTELKAKFDGLGRQKQELEEQVQCFENSNQEMMKEHHQLQGQNNGKEKEISDLKEKLSQTSVKKVEFAQSLEVLAKKVSELESERDTMKQDSDRLQSALTDILESSQVDLSPFKELRSVNNSIIFDSQKTLDKVKVVIDDRSSIMRKLSETEKSVENIEYEIQTTKQQLQQEQEDHGKTKRELEIAVMQISEFESRIKTVTSDFDSHKQAAEKVQVEVGQLQKSRNDQETMIDSIKSQLQASENKSREIQIEKETILIELAAVKESNAKLSEVKSHLEAENQQLVKAKNVLQVHLDKEKQAKKGLEVAVEDLRRTQEENVSMEQVMEERKHKMVQEHEDRVEFLTQQFNMVKEDLEKANQEKKRFEEEHKCMSEEHAAMKEKLEMALKEKNETTEINQALNAEIASVNERIDTAQDERNEIAHKLEQISEETATQLSEKATMISELEEQLDQTNKVKAELESKVSEVQGELQKKKTSFSELEERSKEVEEQLGSMQGVMEQEVSALKFQLSSEAMQYQEKLQSYKTLENELEKLREKCREQDHLIESQQVDVADLTTRLKTLQDDSDKQMSEAQNKNTAKEKDFKLLQDSLAEMTKMLEEQKVSNMNLEEELLSLKADKQGVESHLQQQLTLAENDNMELKKNLIKLVKEKDTLWQWTDKLVHQQKMKASERWLEDKEVNKCMQCETDFGLMVRRHHCRLCGRIFCSKCCNSYILAAQSKNKVRVCEQCFVLHHHSRESDSINTSLLNQDGEVEEDIEDALLTSRLRLSSRVSVNSEVSGVEASGTEASGEEARESRIGPLIGPGDLEPTMLDDSTPGAKFIIGSASSTPTPPTSLTPPTSPTPTGSIGGNSIAVIDSPTEVTQPQMNRDEVNPVIVLDTPLPGAHNIIAKEEDSKGSSEPDFDIISEEEVQSVKEEDLPGTAKDTRSLPMEKSVFSAVITTKELEAGFGCDGEILVKSGHNHSIPIHLDEPGLTLCWEFASAPKTIAFSVTYKETETSDTFDVLIPLCKCNSHRHAVQGELMSRKAGVYTLVFDNQFSRFTSKTVKYSLQIKRPEAAY